MKTSKKLIVLAILSVFCLSAFAQMEVDKPDRLKPKIGIRAGLNLTNFLEEDNDDVSSNLYYMLPGFHAGVFLEIPIGQRFAFEPCIMISRKGFQYEDNWTDSIGQTHDYYQSHSLYYIDIPLTFKVTQEFGKVRIFGAFGPYIGTGIGGNKYDEEKIDGKKDENDYKISWGNSDGKDDYQHMDWGLTFGGGIEIRGIQLSFYYDLGLGNISVYRENGFSIYNKVARISVAYRFGNIQ